MDEWTDCQQSKMESSCSIFVPLVVNAMCFLIVVLICSFFVYNRVVGHVSKVQCSQLCIISKIFCNCASDDRSDVLEKTMKVTVRSLPKKNGVPVKINVILLRFPKRIYF